MERKDLIQDIRPIEERDLLETTQDMKSSGYRLGQICATSIGEQLEVLYSFEKENVLVNLKVTIDAKAPVLPSVTDFYGPAFIYENEMHDLFGITFKNLSLDYGGKFFKIAKATPWNPAYEGGEN